MSQIDIKNLQRNLGQPLSDVVQVLSKEIQVSSEEIKLISEEIKLISEEIKSKVVDVTYDQLVEMITYSKLIPFTYYRITDFATAHYIMGTDDINIGTTEPLIMQAIDTNVISHLAYSEQYPQDIIHYDWNPDNWKFDIAFSAWDEEVLPGFKGVIYFRHDTFNDVLMGHDFRHVLNRRWKRNDPVYDTDETYAKGVKVQVPLDGVYISLKDANSGNLLSDETWWAKIISYDITEYIEKSISIAQDPTDFIDVPCFYSQEADPEDQYNREVRSVHLEPFKDDNNNEYQSASILPNNVFILTPETQMFQVFDIYAKPLCVNNTFLGYRKGNTLEENFANNTIGPGFNNNTIGSNFIGNTIGSNFSRNTIGSQFSRNTISSNFYSNTIGSEFDNNTIGNNFRRNTIGPYLSNLNFTGATHVYDTYNCFLFIRVDGSPRLKYCDNTDTEIIVAANA